VQLLNPARGLCQWMFSASTAPQGPLIPSTGSEKAQFLKKLFLCFLWQNIFSNIKIGVYVISLK
jgi:hypothetical protein